MAAVLVDMGEAKSKCYVCDSSSNPIGCTQSTFIYVGVTQESDCVCCTKKKSDDGMVKRGCEKSTVPTDCFPLINNAVCLDDLCNMATPVVYHVTVMAALAGVGLAYNLLY
jgi:hypothetical protein